MAFPAALGLAGASQALTALTIGFTAPKNPLRLVVTTVVVALTWLFYQAIQDALASRLHVALLSTGMWIQCLKTFDDLCLTRLSFDPETASQPRGYEHTTQVSANGQNEVKAASAILPTKMKTSEFTCRLLFGLESLWNMRGVGTSTEISQIPPWSREDSSSVPSRSRLLKKHVKRIAISYLILDVFANQPPPDIENMMSPRNERLFSRLSEISGEEAIFRFFASLGFWLNTFSVIQLINSAFALLYLGLNLYPVAMIPPIWGQLSDAYSIRKFWGNVWHQTLRRPLTSVSEFIAHKILHMQKGTLLARYCKLFICFYISGALHLPADLSLGIPAPQSNAIAYFLTTALTIMCEDGVQYVFRKIVGDHSSKWQRYFGYAWVCFYMYWMTPSWGYPPARYVEPGDQLVPFSVIREMMRHRK